MLFRVVTSTSMESFSSRNCLIPHGPHREPSNRKDTRRAHALNGIGVLLELSVLYAAAQRKSRTGRGDRPACRSDRIRGRMGSLVKLPARSFLEALVSAVASDDTRTRHFRLRLSASGNSTVARSRSSSRSAWIVATTIAKNIAIENRASPMAVSFRRFKRHVLKKVPVNLGSRYGLQCETLLNVAFI